MPVETISNVRVIRDPEFTQLNNLFLKCKDVRGLIDVDHVFVWDARKATHFDIALQLGMTSGYYHNSVVEFQLYYLGDIFKYFCYPYLTGVPGPMSQGDANAIFFNNPIIIKFMDERNVECPKIL